MSDGDFEVLPRGTIAELRMLRTFVQKLTHLDKTFGIDTPQAIRSEIASINLFYADHNQRYPENGF